MTFYGAKNLAASFKTVRANTIAIANDTGEEHYSFRPTPDSRSIGETLVHISAITSLMESVNGATDPASRVHTMEGFDFMALFGRMVVEEKAPHTKSQIIATLQERGDRFASWLGGLSEDFLAEEVTMMPGSTPPVKTRFEMLLGVKEHEMHHRGQLMMMERMVGVVPHLTRERQARFSSMPASAAKS